MKKRILRLVTLFAISAVMLTGCAESEQQSMTAETEQSVQEVGSQSEGKEEISTVTGTIEAISDFMFIVTDGESVSYAFTFDEKPEGLDSAAVGDEVIVKYTGTISEIDPFMGEVLSVEKQ